MTSDPALDPPAAAPAVVPLAAGLGFTDLRFQGRAGVIATALLQGPGGAALIDPGPSTCLPWLGAVLREHGIQGHDLRALFLTHIHLDHAGATGSLVRAYPHLEVHVHERGAPHLVDPSRLVRSAARLYGAQMEPLWGEVAPVPAANVRSLAGGERVRAGGRELEVAYTPGHAVHHVSYLERETGTAFVGDTAGIRIAGCRYVAPATPPPDIDLEAWTASVRRIEAWRPATLFVTHFGPSPQPAVHLQEFLENLREISGQVRASLELPGGADDERAARFARDWGRSLRRRMSQIDAERYETAVLPWLCWLGLARYWRTREGGEGG